MNWSVLLLYSYNCVWLLDAKSLNYDWKVEWNTLDYYVCMNRGKYICTKLGVYVVMVSKVVCLFQPSQSLYVKV